MTLEGTASVAYAVPTLDRGGKRRKTTMDLAGAIRGVEGAQTALQSADTQQAAAQAKYEDALTTKVSADKAEGDAVAAFNASLDELIAAATAAKVSRLPAPVSVGSVTVR
jgi:hypothetical protein